MSAKNFLIDAYTHTAGYNNSHLAAVSLVETDRDQKRNRAEKVST